MAISGFFKEPCILARRLLSLFLISALPTLLVADDISLKDGRTLTGAKVLSESAASVMIKHDGGISSVSKTILPDDLRAKFPVTETKADQVSIPKDGPLAKSRELAEKGDAKAQFELGNAYFNGEGVSRNFAEAIKWYRQAAEQGDAKAQFKLGRIYTSGEGAPRDYREAIKWHQMAADQGNPESLSKLAECYKKGWGVKQNESEAAKYLLLAAEHGHVPSQKDIFVAYLVGDGVPINLVEALAWLNVIATANEPDYKTLRNRVSVPDPRLLLFAEERSAALFKTISDNQSRIHIPRSRIAPPEASNAKGNGTGVIVSTSGYVLTAAHVVAKSSKITINTSQGSRSAKVIKLDETNDLALLKIESGVYTALPVIASTQVRLGQAVSTIGFPVVNIQGFSPKVTRGDISSMNGPGDDPKKWQISVPVQPGNSGGPLLDERGNVVGIIVAALISELTQNVNYAVKSSVALDFISTYLGPDSPKPSTTEPAPKFEDMVAKAQPAVVLILVN